MTEQKYNILIVEDHSLTRFAIKMTLSNIDFIKNVYEAQDYNTTEEIINNNHIDLILMDLGLPGKNGLEITQIIKGKKPEIKIVIISSHEAEEDVINAIKAGANSYCCKDIEQEELINVIKSTLKGAAWFDSRISKYVLNMQDNIPETIHTKKITLKDYNLTSREYEILKLMCEGYPNSQIATYLNISINTAKSHVCNILQKMNVDDRIQAVIIAIKNNLV